MSLQLTKSEYLLYLKHPAWLWLKKHDKSKLPEFNAQTQAIIDEGNKFEACVESRFKDLTRLGFNNYQEYLSLPARTTEAIKSGARILAQARFETGQLTCICDVVEVVEPGVMDLYEIKASTKPKPEHYEDLAFQREVLEGCGYRLRNIYLLHCNNRYKRQGGLDAEKLTVLKDVTAKVKAKEQSTKRHIAEALKLLEQKSIPDISPGRARLSSFGEWLEIYMNLTSPLPPYSIYHLAYPGSQLIADLEARGITDLADIPEDIKLSDKQRRQVEVTKLGEAKIDKAKIKAFLDSLEYPLYFLDYETLGSVLPAFDGMRPYQQLPFQYSLHIIERPGAEPIHKEFLHTENTNPAEPLCDQLVNDIGHSGTVLAWYDNFEKACNELLAEFAPSCKEALMSINERMQDLMTPFDEGWHTHPDFFGSASIKKVLPALIPELNHKKLNISEGATAQRLWMEAVLDEKYDSAKKKQIMDDLIKYCELDTLAMVRIYQHLVEVCADQVTAPEIEQMSLL